MQAGPTNEDIIKQATQALQRLRQFLTSKDWTFVKDIKGEKPCKIYKKESGNRVASKGVVQDLECTPSQVHQMLLDEEFIKKMYPEMNTNLTLKVINQQIFVSYTRFNGIWPVSDRDFVLVNNNHLAEDYYINVAASTNYPYPEGNKAVRATNNNSGFFIEKTGENKCRASYGSDTDLKGSIPSMVQNKVAQDEGSKISKLNDVLKEWRKKAKK